MKNYILRLSAIVLFVTSIFAFQVSESFAQEAPAARIITVNFARVTQESLVGQDVQAQLESNRVRIDTRASELSQRLTEEEQELQRQQNIVTPAVLEEGIAAYNQLQVAAQNEIRQLQNQQQQAAQQASLEIQRQLRPIIMRIMEERNATLVLDSNTVYHSIGGLDVTTTVIERLNSVMSSFRVTLPAPAAPAAN